MSHQAPVLDFSEFVLAEVPVNNLLGKSYVLRQASEAVAIAYRAASMKAWSEVSQRDDGTRTVRRPQQLDGVAESEASLVAMCMFEVPPGGAASKTPVTLEFVKSLPSSVVKRLHGTVKDISALGEDDPPERKAVLEAFARDDAPVKLQDLRAWVDKLVEVDVKTFRPLRELVKPTDDELKNLRSATTPPSG